MRAWYANHEWLVRKTRRSVTAVGIGTNQKGFKSTANHATERATKANSRDSMFRFVEPHQGFKGKIPLAHRWIHEITVRYFVYTSVSCLYFFQHKAAITQ